MNDITYAVSVDVNNPIIPYNVYVASVLDSNVRYLEITLYQNGNVIALSNTATATASLVTDNVLVNDSVNCTIQDNIITVPLEDLQRHGNLDVQVTVTEGTKVLAIPFPIQVRVTPNIAENAQIDENSLGSYAEVVHEITEARGTHTTLHDAIAAKAPLSTAYTFDSTTANVTYNTANPKTIYLNATVDGEAGIVITAKDNGFQYFLGRRGTLKIRFFTGGTSYSDWTQVTEHVGNKKNSITSSNRTSTDFYPSIKAVVDYLAANYEALSNKLTSADGIDENSTDNEYPTGKAVYNFVEIVTDDIYTDIVTKENLSNKKTTITGYETSNQFYPTIKALVGYVAANYENLSNKLSSEAGIDSNSTDTEYPSAKAVYDFGVEILGLVNDDISNVESRLVLKESSSNKQSSITAVNKASTALYPSIKAVVDYLVANYENLSNKKTTLTGNESSNDFYPTTKAVADALNTKAPASTAYTFDTTTTNVVYNANNPKTIYLNATVDGEKGIVLTSANNNCQYFFGSSKSVKIRNKNGTNIYTDWEPVSEKAANKTSAITSSNKTSTVFYPSIKAVYDFGAQIVDDFNENITETNSNLSDLKAYIGYTDGDILGLHADFENNRFTRLGAATGLTAGQDFNAFPMYGQRRRVVVDSGGVIIDSYSPEDVGESDTDVDVMVYQPKFYYKVVPLKLEKQSNGLGYHIRKANYYISSTPHAGFKLHPLFYDANGNEIDYVLFSAYEASYMWRRQVGTNHYVDTTFHDGVDTDTTIETSAVLKSLPGVKPISGQYKAMNKANMETLAQNKSPNWHLDTIQSVSANQLLMAIELGTFNTQTTLGMGIVYNETSYNATNGSDNCSSLTGSTSALGNVTGMAGETIYDVAGTETLFNTNGKVAVSYRGMENPWGNIWKQVNGINFWGDGNMGGGQAYICSDFNFDESKHIGNYKSTGFSIVNVNGWVSAFGYGNEEYDWLFMPSETTGNNSLPVGDSCACTQNLNGNRIAVYGGRWSSSESGGSFYWACSFVPNYKNSEIGGRLLFVPTATV